MKTKGGGTILLFFLVCTIPPLGHAIFRWWVYAKMRDQLYVPGDKVCAGDISCINEITGEYWADFLVGLILGSPVIFIMTLGLATLVLFAANWAPYCFQWRRWVAKG